MADSTWRDQPKFMSEDTLETLVARIKEHATGQALKRLILVLHGGEPLLLGPEKLDRYLSVIRTALGTLGIEVQIGMQSNGLLLTREIGAILTKHCATVGVSIDGIPGKGDWLRVDHKGVPSGAKLERVLKNFLATPYRDRFTGFIAVADITQDARETFRYLASFDPPSIDFRLPLNHHSNTPRRNAGQGSHTDYGRWYEEIFEELILSKRNLSVRLLSAIVQGLTGQPRADLYWGNEETGIAVIESDGSYELVDNLKSIGNALTKTGLNLKDHSLDEFVSFRNDWIKREGLDQIPTQCSQCKLFSACRGCYYMSRFSKEDRFTKPSVYCTDMMHLIPKIHSRLAAA